MEGCMAPADLWFCNANGSVWRPRVHSNLYQTKQKHVPHHLFMLSVSNDSALRPQVWFDMRKPQKERECDRVHSLVITPGDVMGSQPVFVRYFFLSTHSCVTLLSLGVIRQVFISVPRFCCAFLISTAVVLTLRSAAIDQSKCNLTLWQLRCSTSKEKWVLQAVDYFLNNFLFSVFRIGSFYC